MRRHWWIRTPLWSRHRCCSGEAAVWPQAPPLNICCTMVNIKPAIITTWMFCISRKCFCQCQLTYNAQVGRNQNFLFGDAMVKFVCVHLRCELCIESSSFPHYTVFPVVMLVFCKSKHCSLCKLCIINFWRNALPFKTLKGQDLVKNYTP